MPYAQQLGRYQLLDRIAFGGMAEIFRAKTFDHEGRAHLVAVKRVLDHLTADDDFLRMLVDEAKISALLSHENIARLYEFAHDGDEYFMAMEYVDGKDVRSMLDRHRTTQKTIPPEHVAFIAMEVAHALQAAHTQRDASGQPLNIVHRDVSPSNVLLSYRGEVKLCDFGIAKATTTRVHTKTGVIKGKVKYMSPEQAMGRKLDHRSDLFSLGTVMYEMLTLAAPFTAASEVELIFAVRDARRRPVREIDPEVPEELAALLDRMMSRSRSARFQSGAEVAAALQEFLERFRPGYRRSNFGRFMRTTFEADIERELRLLEEYIIDGGDPSKVGENLIAEALGQDAPYTKFTAATSGSRGQMGQMGQMGSTGAYLGETTEPPGGDLHAEPTRILTRNRVLTDLPSLGATPPLGGQPLEDSGEMAPLSEQATRILDPARPPLHELPTGPKLSLPDEGDLHAQVTKILDLQETRPESAPLHALETQILNRPAGVRGDVDTHVPTLVSESGHDTQVGSATEPHPRVLLDDDLPALPTTTSAAPRRRRDTVPSSSFSDPDSEESTSVPLHDEDLEPSDVDDDVADPID